MDFGISTCIRLINQSQPIPRPYGYDGQNEDAYLRLGEYDARSRRLEIPDQGDGWCTFRSYFPGLLTDRAACLGAGTVYFTSIRPSQSEAWRIGQCMTS